MPPKANHKKNYLPGNVNNPLRESQINPIYVGLNNRTIALSLQIGLCYNDSTFRLQKVEYGNLFH